MKFSLVALAATLAVASAADCDLTKLTPLLSDSNVATCSTDSGFSFTSASKPSAEVVSKICTSTACKNVLAAVKALNLGDCTLLGMQLETDLLNPIDAACGTGSGSSTGSSAGTATVGSTTGSSSSVSASSSTGTTGSSSADATTVNTPSTTTTTPTPTTSAASSVAMAASATVVAVAAAFL
ncbi:Elicitin-like protein, partial [Globisporangium splendens]